MIIIKVGGGAEHGTAGPVYVELGMWRSGWKRPYTKPCPQKFTRSSRPSAQSKGRYWQISKTMGRGCTQMTRI